jgi:hypothetical protein
MSRDPQLPDDLARPSEPPTDAFMVRHIPDEPLPQSAKQECVDAHDCRAFVRPAPHTGPMGKR